AWPHPVHSLFFLPLLHQGPAVQKEMLPLVTTPHMSQACWSPQRYDLPSCAAPLPADRSLRSTVPPPEERWQPEAAYGARRCARRRDVPPRAAGRSCLRPRVAPPKLEIRKGRTSPYFLQSKQ